MSPDRSVRQSLTRAFGALVLLIVGAGLAEMSTVLIQHRVVSELADHVQPLQLANAHLRGVMADGQRGLRGYLLTGDSEQLDTYRAARGDYAAAVERVRALDTAAEAAALDAQVDRADAWWALAERQRQAPPRTAAASGFVAAGKPLFRDFLAANQAFDTDLAARAERLHRRSAVLGRLTVGTVAAITLVAAALAAITATRTTRRITRPLGDLVTVLERMRTGRHEERADPDTGPSEIRAVAAAVNSKADEAARTHRAEQESARLRGEVRALGYRIRGHLTVDDALREALDGLAGTLRADHVLIRMVDDRPGAASVASLSDEHLGGPLAELAGADVTWLASGDIWCSGDPDGAGTAQPPEAERRACEAIGGGHVLTVAVSGGNERLGALTLIRDAGPAWSPPEMRLAESVATDLGHAVHHARLYERELHLVARLQELDTVKTDFMSTVSHELRTPLTSISGYLELLLDAEAGELNNPQRRMLEVIARNTRRLRELIEDMLVLSKIESGAFHTVKRDVELGALIDSALVAIEPVAAKASVTLHADVAGPLHLHADPEHVDRVLMNLLSNAVKFTPPEGTVTVHARADGDDEVEIAVADTGMGIPEAEQQGLFGRFFRASNAIHQAIPGTGLGLAIVAMIVESHGGTIGVQSTQNVGTTVTVRLPR